jgi:hypothetical protein
MTLLGMEPTKEESEQALSRHDLTKDWIRKKIVHNK